MMTIQRSRGGDGDVARRRNPAPLPVRAPRARLSRSRQWDEVGALMVVDRMVARKLPMFAAWPEFARDDLVSEGLMAARAGWPAYDPAKGSAATFVYMVSWRAVSDLWRTRSRRDAREKLVAVADWIEAGDAAGLPGDEGDRAGQTLAEWLAEIYRAAKRLGAPARARRGRWLWHWAQVVATYFLMRKLSLSSRGCAALLAGDADLRAAMRMGRCPSHMFCQRAADVVTENLSAGRRRE